MAGVLIFLVSLGARAPRVIWRRRADFVMENLALRRQVTALKKGRPRPLLDDIDQVKRWVAFLRSHKDEIAAMDLFTVPTVSLRLLYGITLRPSLTARVVAMPRVGGLHHRYEWCEAA